MVDDCLVLLDYVAKHPDEDQTIANLSNVCLIPPRQLYRILSRDLDGTTSALERAAVGWRFDYEVFPKVRWKDGKILFAVYCGY